MLLTLYQALEWEGPFCQAWGSHTCHMQAEQWELIYGANDETVR